MIKPRLRVEAVGTGFTLSVPGSQHQPAFIPRNAWDLSHYTGADFVGQLERVRRRFLAQGFDSMAAGIDRVILHLMGAA